MNIKNLDHNQIDQLMDEVLDLAYKSKEDLILLMAFLRKLELVHREIREELFEPSLPNTRHDLYWLLKDIDESGGWPYIERMRLRSICENLLQTCENLDQQP